MKVYISGPISGRNRRDYLEEFAITERWLIRHGYDVINPTRLAPSRHLWIYKMMGYKLTLLYDLWHLFKCDTIIVLNDWEKSKGVKLEKATAEIFGIKEVKLKDLL